MRIFKPIPAALSTFSGLLSVLEDANFTLALHGNHPQSKQLLFYGEIDALRCDYAAGAFEKLKAFYDEKQDFLACALSYELKDDVEDLQSNHPNPIGFPYLYCCQPRWVFRYEEGAWEVGFLPVHDTEEAVLEALDHLIKNHKEKITQQEVIQPWPVESKEEYLEKIKRLLLHIQDGDIYEINYCQAFIAEDVSIQPKHTWEKLNALTNAPFSCYLHLNKSHLLCGSPERFLQKKGNVVRSQPIKGTIKRGATPEEDQALKTQLQNDPKERSENIMIVDLVRNDLSRTAKKGTVEVEELCGIYSFDTVHQMISTVRSEVAADTHPVEVIKNAFPMGSMTGAPKVRAMQLIDQYETTRRGMYSGAVGYFTPEGDFDFNVVIRSILYNASNHYLSVMAGGAITAGSDPEKEYAESLLKAQAMFKALESEA